MDRQQASEDLQDAKRLANLVADQPAEIAKLGRLPLDRLRVARDERIDRLLLQHPHGRLRAAQHQDRCRGIAPLAEPGRLAGEKALENLAEDLIFAEQLVDRRALIEAQQTEFGRFAHHTRVGGDLLIGRRPEVRRYLLEQLGNMVEKLVRREDLTFLDVEQLIEPFEPQPGERDMLHPQSGGEVVDGHSKVRNGHLCKDRDLMSVIPTVIPWYFVVPVSRRLVASVLLSDLSRWPFCLQICDSAA